MNGPAKAGPYDCVIGRGVRLLKPDRKVTSHSQKRSHDITKDKQEGFFRGGFVALTQGLKSRVNKARRSKPFFSSGLLVAASGFRTSSSVAAALVRSRNAVS